MKDITDEKIARLMQSLHGDFISIDIPESEWDRVLQKIKNAKPFDQGSSLHCYDLKYIIDNVKYEIIYEIGTNEVVSILQIEPKDWFEHIPKQLELFDVKHD